MNKLRNKVNLDQTLAFTQSSHAYKHPYKPGANPAARLYEKVATFFNVRNIENEFVDFRNYKLEKQFTEIYSEAHLAFKRNDKVIL